LHSDAINHKNCKDSDEVVLQRYDLIELVVAVMTVQMKRRKVPILMYHSISRTARPQFKKFTILPEVFAEHMSYLYRHKYQPITVTQFVRAIACGGEGISDRSAVLTFDDGFADFYTDILPILGQYGFVATLYVTTAFVGGTSRWLQREGEVNRPMLTWPQLVDISACGIECGAHSHTHPQLDMLPPSAAGHEIRQCKRILEEQLAQEVSSFAYPFGYYDATVKRLVQEAGYSSACAVRYAMSSTADDPFALARFSVTGDTQVDDLVTLLTGRLSIARIGAQVRSSMWRFIRRRAAWLNRRLREGMVLGCHVLLWTFQW
jgi:peptidoglycan/xylan/chitin deacetylase (PgdA/CDA1 family)